MFSYKMIDSSELQNYCQSKCESLAWFSFRNGDRRTVGKKHSLIFQLGCDNLLVIRNNKVIVLRDFCANS